MQLRKSTGRREQFIFKKLISVLLICTLILSMSVSALASDNKKSSDDTSPVGTEIVSDPVAPGYSSVEITGEAIAQNLQGEVIDIGGSTVALTGETFNIPNTRAGQAIEKLIGILPGQLTNENTWDYYLFYSETPYFGIAKFVTDNANYTMTLGILDSATNTIALTDYVMKPNESFMANFGNDAIFAWVIQSTDGTFGNSYTLQYNMSLPSNSEPFYASDDLQKLYYISNSKLKVNNVVQNIDYKYDVQWDINIGGQNRWHELHITMNNANVALVHVGGVRYKEGLYTTSFPNTVVLKLEPGGNFYHFFTQNPPYINLGTKDIAGIETPRAISYSDIVDYGPHYLIYDFNTDKVVEFASAFAKPWSNIGDKSDLVVF